MEKAFHVFTRNGRQFLLIPNGPNCLIMDIEGNNYGSYLSLESFDRMSKKEGGFKGLVLGKCAVQFRFI